MSSEMMNDAAYFMESNNRLCKKIDSAIKDTRTELMKAIRNWPAFNSAHEGYAVLLEEVDELWDHVKTNQKRRDIEAMRKECIQVAAMALRFAVEICDEKNGRK